MPESLRSQSTAPCAVSLALTIEVVETGRRRRWTSAEKLRIVEESFSGRD
jgi:hypothetical protein